MKRVVAMLLLSSVAAADPVNLLTHAPTIIAVSSTVDSATFLPEHLIDGDRSTAWNSAAGHTHAWIAFRVPADAHVTAIKMTVGFTARDWFKQNLRIDKVNIEHVGKVTTAKLDPDSKELQTIAIDGSGGDYTITIASTVPGTNKDWNEVVVSELEVWGTSSSSTTKKPHVNIGSLDVDCVHALWPKAKGGRIATAGIRSVVFSDPICLIDLGAGKSEQHDMTLALMRGNTVADKLEKSFDNADQRLVTEFFALGSETALLVSEENNHYGEMTVNAMATHTLYRIASGKLVAVTSYETHSQSVEQWGEGHTCTLTVGAHGKSLPELVLACEDAGGSAEGTPAPAQKSVTKLHWNGTRYE